MSTGWFILSDGAVAVSLDAVGMSVDAVAASLDHFVVTTGGGHAVVRPSRDGGRGSRRVGRCSQLDARPGRQVDRPVHRDAGGRRRVARRGSRCRPVHPWQRSMLTARRSTLFPGRPSAVAVTWVRFAGTIDAVTVTIHAVAATLAAGSRSTGAAAVTIDASPAMFGRDSPMFLPVAPMLVVAILPESTS